MPRSPTRLSIRRLPLLAPLAVCVAACHGHAQSRAPAAGSIVGARTSLIDSVVTAALRDRGIPGASVALLLGDSIVHLKGYGVTRIDRPSPVTPSTVFQIASLTKPFVAMAVLSLAEEGRVSLDAPARRYLDWLPPQYATITVRQLLTHTAGVAPDMRRENIDEISEEEFKRRFIERPPSFAPGTSFQYANAGYTLLSQIVERVSRQDLGTFLKQRIFDPLGMRTTSYRRPAVDDDTHAVGYDLVDGRLREMPHIFAGRGNSGIESTAEDLARFACALQTRRLLSAKSYEAMFSPGKLAADTALNFPFRSARSAYGFGWFITTDRGDSLVTHGGAIAGFSSVLHRLPGRNWTIIVLANAKQGTDRQGQAEAVAGLLLDALRR